MRICLRGIGHLESQDEHLQPSTLGKWLGSCLEAQIRLAYLSVVLYCARGADGISTKQQRFWAIKCKNFLLIGTYHFITICLSPEVCKNDHGVVACHSATPHMGPFKCISSHIVHNRIGYALGVSYRYLCLFLPLFLVVLAPFLPSFILHFSVFCMYKFLRK